MILTGLQIVDLAMLAGLMVDKEMLDDESLETEFQIYKDGDKTYAGYEEYPDEGLIELG